LNKGPTERELRRLFREAASAPLPDPDLSDEQLAEFVRDQANDPDVPDPDDDLPRPRRKRVPRAGQG